MEDRSAAEEGHRRRRGDRAPDDQFRQAFDDAPIGMALASPDGRFTRVNAGLAQIVGRPVEWLEEQGFAEITHPDDLPATQRNVQSLLDGEARSFTMEKRYLRGDGRPVWVQLSVSLIRDDEGRPLSFLGHIEDISERKLAEQHGALLHTVTMGLGAAPTMEAALGHSLRAVCETTGWAMGEAWILGRDGRIHPSPEWHTAVPGMEGFRAASEAATFPPGEGLPGRVWASRRAQWVADVSRDLTFPRAPAAAAAGLRAAFAVPVLADEEVVAVLEFFTLERREEDTALLEMVSSIAAEVGEILARRGAEDALRESETRFRSVTEAASEAIIIADAAGLIRYWNQGARDIFDFEPEDVEGRPLTMIMPERFHAAHWAGIERVRATGTSELAGRLLELTGCRRGGGEFPVELSLSTWEVGGDRWFGGIVRDISARRDAEAALEEARTDLERHAAELERSNADLQQFAYAASHDLAEPLHVVRGYLELLTRRYAGKLDEDADRFIEYAMGAAGRMQALITDLLAYSRVSTAPPARDPVDCRALVEEVLAGLEHRVQERAATVAVEDLPTVSADAIQLGRVFQNLIANALKFAGSEQPPEVRVGAARDDGGWRLTVVDNGPGIPADARDTVFAMFERLSADEPGTGMGLAICQRIVERHGGRIWVEDAETGGAAFHFTIPDVPAPDHAPGDGPPSG